MTAPTAHSASSTGFLLQLLPLLGGRGGAGGGPSVNSTAGKEAEASGRECAKGSERCCHLNQHFPPVEARLTVN